MASKVLDASTLTLIITNAPLSGVKLVFHVATAAPTSENALSEDLMRRVNIDGTQYVIDACVQQQVEKLIYTSSASVAFDGTDVLDKSEEELGYASPPIDHYTSTKVLPLLICRSNRSIEDGV